MIFVRYKSYGVGVGNRTTFERSGKTVRDACHVTQRKLYRHPPTLPYWIDLDA
jgi:hypothetical protein